jgi:hypothetical protein
MHSPFDIRFLEAANFACVVVADTHHMLAGAEGGAEFASRSRQSARAEQAIRLAASLRVDCAFHLGDLVQEFPGTRGFAASVEEVRACFAREGWQPIIVAGNHDVGDKPDATMPTEPVTAEGLRGHEERFGPSWHSLDRGPFHLVVLNSQLFNTTHPERAAQQQWLEADLASAAGKRILIFLHLPPFLHEPDEPGLGHYDNVGEPDRAWLLGLCRRFAPEHVFAAHVHWRFRSRLGRTTFETAPSTSFTRPGFGHLFVSTSAPEQGRDDAPKLGFLLLRGVDARLDVHLIRTRGELLPAEPASHPAPSRLVTRTTAGLPHSPLGVSLAGPLANVTEVPEAWPSAIRQRVRNDYPLLALEELGVRHLRAPLHDLADTLQQERLALMQAAGCTLTATAIWEGPEVLTRFEARGQAAETWELRLPGGAVPREALRWLLECARANEKRVALSPVLPNERVPGKQHRRTRCAYYVSELRGLSEELERLALHVDRVLICSEPGQAPCGFYRSLASLPELPALGKVDLFVVAAPVDPASAAYEQAAHLFGAAPRPEARVYFSPLVELDRTMDRAAGLLDTLCNPQPAFHALRCLNTLLFHRDVAWTDPGDGAEGWHIVSRDHAAALRRDADGFPVLHLWDRAGEQETVCMLAAGTTRVILRDARRLDPE